MTLARILLPVGVAASLAFTVPALAQKPLTPSQMVDPKILVARIDANCAVFRKAVETEAPSEVVRRGSSTWKVTSGPAAASAERVTHNVTYAKIWKQSGNYVWAHWVSHDSSGDQHSTQLCFRSDGTLARARQATTVPSLDAASASQAYYNTDGSLIRKSALFVLDDPAIVKRVANLPFFKLLP